MGSTYDQQNIYFISVKDTIDTYKPSLFKSHKALISTLLGSEALGTLDSIDDQCNYIDVDLGLKRRCLRIICFGAELNKVIIALIEFNLLGLCCIYLIILVVMYLF